MLRCTSVGPSEARPLMPKIWQRATIGTRLIRKLKEDGGKCQKKQNGIGTCHGKLEVRRASTKSYSMMGHVRKSSKVFAPAIGNWRLDAPQQKAEGRWGMSEKAKRHWHLPEETDSRVLLNKWNTELLAQV